MGTPKRRRTRTGHLEMGNAEEAEEMNPALDMEGPVAIMWDIENCPIPAGVPPLDVSGNIRHSLLVHGGVKGAITTFSAYGDYSHMPKSIRQGCQKTGINLIDVPNGKKDAADKAILIDMFLFALDNRPPALILLISGDVDFAPALHKLRQRGYTIAVALPRLKVHSALSNAGKFVWDWNSLASNQGLGTISRFNLDFMAAHITKSSLTAGECQGHKPVPRNANVQELLLADVDKHGLCFEAKGVNSTSPGQTDKHGLCFEAKGVNSTSPGQTEDISVFKDEILRLVSMNGGKLPLGYLASYYERAFKKRLCLVKYGYRKLQSLIQEMGDLCMEGDGQKKYVYIKIADTLNISINSNENKRKRENS